MAGELLMSVSKDERERAIYRSRRMYQSDLDSNIATVLEKARLEWKDVVEQYAKDNAQKDKDLADKEAEIASLRAQIEKLRNT